jgi:DNA polymerase-1
MPKVTTIGFEEYLEDNVKDITRAMAWMKDKNMKLCESTQELHDFIDKCIERNVCALDLEATGLNTRVRKDGVPYIKILGFSIAYDVSNAIYVATNHRGGVEYNLPEAPVMDEIRRLCNNCIIIVHNAKYDLQVLKNEGIIVNQFDRFEDTLILARLYDAGQKEIGLKYLSDKILNQPMVDFDEITGGTKQFTLVSPKICYIYAASDAICTYGLYEFFMTQKTVIDQRPIYNLEKRLVPVVMQMEANLIKIDREYLLKEKDRIKTKLTDIEKEVHELAGEVFNIASTQQLGKILFDKLKYRYPEKEKTARGQYKTDIATLEKIADEHPIVKKLIEHRELEKSLGTYVENLIKNCDEDNCIKLSFNQNGTDTGRFSSPGGKGIDQDGYSAVNVQSIPANYDESVPDIRKAFIARPGKKIVAMDFSGEELRVAANLSREKKWVDEFLYGSADLHTATGKVIFRKEEITKAERQASKTTNFLVMYGGGPRGLAEQAKLSEKEAKRILTAFFEGLPQLDRWIKRERALARKRKFAQTEFGRIRPLHMFYDSGDRGLEAHADRCATNFKIQGVCADIMKTVMVRVDNWIKANHLEDEIKLLLTMHDELVFEMPADKLEEYIPPINNIMCLKNVLQEEPLKWPVPLTVDAEYGDSWHVTNDFFKEHPELRDSVAPIEFHAPTQVTIPLVEEVKVEVTAEVSVEQQIDPKPEETPPPSTTLEPVIVPAGTADTDGNLDYIVQRTVPSIVRRLNDIILFLDEEAGCPAYSGPKKTLRLYSKDGSSMLISNVKVSADAFVGLARYFGL